LKRETFLSNAEITALFGNIQEIVTFQRQFLQNLEEALEIEPDFHRFDHSSQFRVSSHVVMSCHPLVCPMMIGTDWNLCNFLFFADQSPFSSLFLFPRTHRTFSLLLDLHFYTMLIISSCTRRSVQVIVRHRKFYIQVSKIDKLKTFPPSPFRRLAYA
jgi:ribosomal protein RSM22 (predicted rRNA methylase)